MQNTIPIQDDVHERLEHRQHKAATCNESSAVATLQELKPGQSVMIQGQDTYK